MPNHFESYESVQVGDWGCKVSKYDNQVMVFMWHLQALDSYIHYFDNEHDAVMWIEYMSCRYV